MRAEVCAPLADHDPGDRLGAARAGAAAAVRHGKFLVRTACPPVGPPVIAYAGALLFQALFSTDLIDLCRAAVSLRLSESDGLSGWIPAAKSASSAYILPMPAIRSWFSRADFTGVERNPGIAAPERELAVQRFYPQVAHYLRGIFRQVDSAEPPHVRVNKA